MAIARERDHVGVYVKRRLCDACPSLKLSLNRRFGCARLSMGDLNVENSTSSITHHSYTASAAVRGDLAFTVLPKDTSTRGREEPGIKPPTFWFVDDPLYLPNHHCCQ
ncbi:unnamed protein product [Pleuronectes platessa]|uniref:Uncharacterized protein n=1 Tax=Pleuronectes platessa TaxID=8262 RepID=A0A9N7VH40_PLEPL|nr:unnamed protein product [Pleuronectes platessa]